MNRLCARSAYFSGFACSAHGFVLESRCRGLGVGILVNRTFHLLDRNVPHAQMMAEAADRLVTRSAGQFGSGFDHRGDRVERSPMPGAGGPEDPYRRGSERGGHVEEA